MKKLKLSGLWAALICLSVITMPAQAQESWTLDNEGSSLAFVTTKLEHIAEVLSFKALSGVIQPDGSANLIIDVDGIDAIFEIRDDRMKEFLFNMVEFPEIQISAQIDMETVAAISEGETAVMAIDATMSLMGSEHSVPAEVLVTNAGGSLIVSSAKPVLLNAGVLGLQEGVAKLGELAGGIPISHAVPVSFSLRFE